MFNSRQGFEGLLVFQDIFPSPTMDARTRFTLLDFVRILGGLLLCNAIASYFFTSSALWGYDDTKYVNSKYWIQQWKATDTVFTLKDMRESLYNNDQLLLSINRTVFDVSASPEIYHTEKSRSRYSQFTARDCTRMFINGCFDKTEQCTYDLRNLGYDKEYADDIIKQWVKFYENHPRYWKVGHLDTSEEEKATVDDIPEQCLDGIQFPSHL